MSERERGRRLRFGQSAERGSDPTPQQRQYGKDCECGTRRHSTAPPPAPMAAALELSRGLVIQEEGEGEQEQAARRRRTRRLFLENDNGVGGGIRSVGRRTDGRAGIVSESMEIQIQSPPHRDAKPKPNSNSLSLLRRGDGNLLNRPPTTPK